MEANSLLLLVRFCKTTKRDAMDTLKACDAPIFKSYLVWRMQHSRIKKESAITTYWKVLSMWYAQETHRFMDESVLYDIRNVCGIIFLFSYNVNVFVVDSCAPNTPFSPRRFRKREG